MIRFLGTLVAATICSYPALADQTFQIVIPVAPSATYTDSAGNTWTVQLPSPVTIGTMVFHPASSLPPPPPLPPPLATGRYTILSSGLAPDAGWHPDVGAYISAGDGNSCQKWIWNGTTLQTSNVGTCSGITGYMIDSSGRAKLAATGDKFSIAASGTGGYIVKDLTTGRYLALSGNVTGDPGSLLFSPTVQTVWTANAN